MRPTKRTTTISALALAATLTLAACSTGDDTTAGGGTDGATTTADSTAGTPDGAASTDAAAGTQGTDQAAATLDTDDLPDPVAEVNGEQIGKDDFLSAFESQRASAQQQAQMTGMPVDETLLRDQVVDLLIDAELLEQEGENLGLGASEEDIDAELETLAADSGSASTEELMTLLEEQGVDEEQVREELGRLVLIDQLVEERGGVEEPSEQELKDYYEELTGQPADGAASTGGPDDAAESAPAGQAAAPPYEDVRDQVATQLTQQRENEVLTTLLEELRADADITSHV